MFKKIVLYLLLFVSPFALMILVNEYNRPEKPYIISFFDKRLEAYNSDEKLPNACTWSCHDSCVHRNKNQINTGALIQGLYNLILEFNEIETIRKEPKLNNGEIYTTMNIISLVILWPLLMFIILVANIELFLKRRNSLK